MPFSESEEGKLKEWILAKNADSAFNCCSHQPLKKMTGPPLHFDLDPTVKPVDHNVPDIVSLHWHQQVKEGLEADCRMGVLEKLTANTPVEWLHRMVLTPKKMAGPEGLVTSEQGLQNEHPPYRIPISPGNQLSQER